MRASPMWNVEWPEWGYALLAPVCESCLFCCNEARASIVTVTRGPPRLHRFIEWTPDFGSNWGWGAILLHLPGRGSTLQELHRVTTD